MRPLVLYLRSLLVGHAGVVGERFDALAAQELAHLMQHTHKHTNDGEHQCVPNEHEVTHSITNINRSLYRLALVARYAVDDAALVRILALDELDNLLECGRVARLVLDRVLEVLSVEALYEEGALLLRAVDATRGVHVAAAVQLAHRVRGTLVVVRGEQALVAAQVHLSMFNYPMRKKNNI